VYEDSRAEGCDGSFREGSEYPNGNPLRVGKRSGVNKREIGEERKGDNICSKEAVS